MPVQYVGCDIWPEFAERVGERVAADRVYELGGERAWRPTPAGVIEHRDSLRHTPAQQFGNVKAVVSVIVRRDDDTRACIEAAPQDRTLAHGVIPFVLVKHGGQRKDDQIIAVRLVEKSSPVVSPVSRKSLSELWVGHGPLRQGGGDANENK